MANNENVHGRPSGDASTSSSMGAHSIQRMIQRPEGDASTTSSSGDVERQVEESLQVVQGSGEGRPVEAQANYAGRTYASPGPSVEQSPLPPNRPVDEMHLNLVASECGKPLLNALLATTNLSELELQECRSIKNRELSCSKLLEYWKNQGDNAKSFSDLINLLQQTQCDNVPSLVRRLNDIRV